MSLILIYWIFKVFLYNYLITLLYQQTSLIFTPTTLKNYACRRIWLNNSIKEFYTLTVSKLKSFLTIPIKGFSLKIKTLTMIRMSIFWYFTCLIRWTQQSKSGAASTIIFHTFHGNITFPIVFILFHLLSPSKTSD